MMETVFRSIEWTPSRSGEIAPVALFNPVEIDGCTVSRASLHNLTFIKDLELHPGCRILVSKRNMIIPHIEENLDRGRYAPSLIPKRCPCCGKPTRIYARSGGKGGKWQRSIVTILTAAIKHCASSSTSSGRRLWTSPASQSQRWIGSFPRDS